MSAISTVFLSLFCLRVSVRWCGFRVGGWLLWLLLLCTYFHSIEELRTPSAVSFQQRSMSVSMTKEQQQSGNEWSPLQVASSTRLALAPQMARPLLIANSQNDLRFKQQMLPPELPLRRGGSTDKVLLNDAHNNSLAKSSISNSSKRLLD